MPLHKRVAVLCAIVLGSGLLIWSFWPAASFVPSVQLPEGVSLAEVLQSGKSETPKGWFTFTNAYSGSGQSRLSLGARERTRQILERVRYETHEMLGRTLCRVPNPPVVDYVTPRLLECSDDSGEKYLLAKEFNWEVSTPVLQGDEWTFLSFVWGDTNSLRHARDRIPLIEGGILKNGIFGMRLKWSLPGQRGVRTIEYLHTNRCAIIRDTRGWMKIVPIEYLKAYADAGLVSISHPKE